MTEHLPAAGGILRFVEPEKQLVLAGFREDLQLARRVGQAVFNGLVHAAYEPLGVLNDLTSTVAIQPLEKFSFEKNSKVPSRSATSL